MEAARRQAATSNLQAQIANETRKGVARQALFLALTQRVGEVISNEELQKFTMPPHECFEFGLRQQGYQNQTDAQFVNYAANALKGQNIPVHDRVRRQSLFRGLDKLLMSCSNFQRDLLGDALRAQIHDSTARMLIVKSVAEADHETLRLYGKLGIDFFVLNECPNFAAELHRRFDSNLR